MAPNENDECEQEYDRRKVKAYPLAPFGDMEEYSAKGNESLIPAHPPPIPDKLPTAIDADTYIYLDPSQLEPELWSFEEFVTQNAHKWYSADARAREDIVEVDRLRAELLAMQGKGN